MPNLTALGLDVRDLSGVVLSHGHYDHTGGLEAVLAARQTAGLDTPVWCHKDVFAPHLKDELRPRDIGPPLGGMEAYQRLGARFNWVEGEASPWPGIRLLAPIPRRTSYEGDFPGLVTMEQGRVRPDPFLDDLTLVVEGSGPPTAVTGCAHCGVINLLLEVEEACGQKPGLVVGGTHLGPVSAERKQAVLAELVARPELTVAAGHCTGKAAGLLAAKLGERFNPLHCGLVLEL